MYMKLLPLLCLILDISLFSTRYAYADNHKRASENSGQSNLIINSSRAAAQLVKARVGGKVLKVKKISRSGRTYYLVKLVKKDGHVLSFRVNAVTGQLIRN